MNEQPAGETGGADRDELPIPAQDYDHLPWFPHAPHPQS